MWINPATNERFGSHGAIRKAHPQVSMPRVLADRVIASLGLMPLVPTGKPVVNPLTHDITEGDPILVDDHYEQQWEVVAVQQAESDSRLAASRAARWDEIKSIRDAKTQNGGFPSDGKWFHSDIFSRIQQIGLTIMGNGVPPGLQWKTMDGSKVPMNPAKAGAVFAAAAAQDLALFAHAEALKAAVDAAEDPDSVDIQAGWPQTFE